MAAGTEHRAIGERTEFRTLAESLGVVAQHPRVKLSCQVPPSLEDVGHVDAR